MYTEETVDIFKWAYWTLKPKAQITKKEKKNH